MLNRFDSLTSAIIALVIRHSGSCLLAYALAVALSIAAAASWLGVNTDSSQMLSSTLGFQQKTRTLNRDFPGIKNAIVVVIRSKNADVADAVAKEITNELSKSENVTGTYAPSIDPFFLQNGLLFQSVDDLDKTLDRLNKSASLLASLRSDPQLANFMHALFTAEELAKGAVFDRTFLDDFYKDVSATIGGRLNGKFTPLSWSKTTSATQDEQSSEIQRIIYVTPQFDFTAIQPVKASYQTIQSAIANVSEDLREVSTIGITGDPVLRFEELRSVSRGIGLSLGLSFLLVALLLWIAFRNFVHVLLTFTALVTALVISTGFAATVFGALNLVSVAFVVLLVGLGLDFTIHVLAHLRDAKQSDASQTLIKMGQGIGGALFLSALTTSLAFLSFTPTDFTGMAQLGVLGAGGVFIAYIVSITLIPALISRVPWFRKALDLKAKPDAGDGDEKASLLSHIIVRFTQPIALVLVLLAIVSLFYAGYVRFNADPIALRDPDSASMQALNRLQERIETVPYRLSVVRADQAAAVEVAAKIKKLKSVHNARTLLDFVPSDQDEKLELIDYAIPTLDTIVNGEGLEHAKLPEGKTPLQALHDFLSASKDRPEAQRVAMALKALELASPEMQAAVEADIFRFFPNLIQTINAQLGVDTVTLEEVPSFFTQRFVNKDGQWRVDVTPRKDVRNQKALREFVAEVEGFDGQAAGAPLQIAYAGQTVSKAMLVALGLAGSSILLVSFLVLRRWRTVLAIFIPLTMAALLTAAASVVLDIPFNYANVIVLPLLIGLGVDSGIHVAIRRNRMKSNEELYHSSTPRAVLFSGLTTIAAFATLGVSDHRGTASMGQMLAIAISASLLVTIVITPILINFFDKSLHRR